MRANFFCFLFITFSLASCSIYSEPAMTIQQIVVDGSNVKEELDISSLIDDISFIRLEESPGNFIGEAYKVLKTKNYYIIFDKENAKRIVVFDNNGKFVKNVMRIEYGPELTFQKSNLAIPGKAKNLPIELNEHEKNKNNTMT